MGERDHVTGTRNDNTLTIEGENYAQLGPDGALISMSRGDGKTVSHPGDEVLVERSKHHGVLNPCETFGHRANADGSACRFCGAGL